MRKLNRKFPRSKHNDLGFTVSFRNAINLLQNYQAARKAGVPHKQACSYAIATRKEACFHNTWCESKRGRTLQLTSRKRWQHYRWATQTTSVNTSPARFRALLINTCGVMPSLKAEPTAAVLKAIAKGKPGRVAACKAAVANYKAVVGKLPSAERNGDLLRQYLLGSLSHRDWATTRSGRQLFVKGWGKFSFSIVAALKTYLTPAELTAEGYGFFSVADLKLAKSKPWRAWFTRHWQWWKPNLARIDELSSGGYRHFAIAEAYLREHPDCTPQGLLTHIAGVRQRNEPARDEEGSELLSRDAAYPWLANVQPQAVELPANFACGGCAGTLAPVRDGNQLAAIAGQLGNCASMYHADIAERECMLVACVDQHGNAIGLGELLPNGKWGQISGYANKKLPAEVKQLFAEYTPIAMLAAWVGDVPQLPAPALALPAPPAPMLPWASVQQSPSWLSA